MTLFSKRSEAGIAHLAILITVIVVIGVALAVFLLVRSSSDDDESTNETNPSSSVQVNQRNVARKQDVSRFLGAVTEYINNNNGQLPSSYSNNVISGSAGETNNVAVVFEILEPAAFAKGQQSPVTSTSTMRLVTQAECGENGQTVSGQSRSYVVQYALEKVNGGYTSTCQEG